MFDPVDDPDDPRLARLPAERARAVEPSAAPQRRRRRIVHGRGRPGGRARAARPVACPWSALVDAAATAAGRPSPGRARARSTPAASRCARSSPSWACPTRWSPSSSGRRAAPSSSWPPSPGDWCWSRPSTTRPTSVRSSATPPGLGWDGLIIDAHQRRSVRRADRCACRWVMPWCSPTREPSTSAAPSGCWSRTASPSMALTPDPTAIDLADVQVSDRVGAVRRRRTSRAQRSGVGCVDGAGAHPDARRHRLVERGRRHRDRLLRATPAGLLTAAVSAVVGRGGPEGSGRTDRPQGGTPPAGARPA